MSAAQATSIITTTDDDEQPYWRRVQEASDRCSELWDAWYSFSNRQGVSDECRAALWVAYVHAVAVHERIQEERDVVSVVEWSSNPRAYRYGVRRPGAGPRPPVNDEGVRRG